MAMPLQHMPPEVAMPREKRPGDDEATAQGGIDDLGATTDDRLPPRRRGGQELPDSVQDRPEQNAGYDAAVHGGAPAADDRRNAVVDAWNESGTVTDAGPNPAPDRTRADNIDDQAERDVIAEVRRRERRQP
jgi:hypothetical protein